MRHRLILLFFLVSASSAEPVPAEVDASLTTVVSTGSHRFLEYRVCSPEHCWSNAYLQWYDDNSSQFAVVETTAVTEIDYGSAVASAKWVWVNEKPQLEVRVMPSHGGFEPYVMIIIPGVPGEYSIEKP